MPPPRWLLLVLQVPSKPDYLRVKVRRRLARMEAVAVRDALYLLPATDESIEDARWLQREVEAVGGRLLVWDATVRAGIADKDLEEAVARGHLALERAKPAGKPMRVKREDYHGRRWVTRTDVHVDRIASAWLIRRFIDANATFRFVDQDRYRAKAGDVAFDMFDAEFTHEGDQCTFETLVARFGLRSRALTHVAHIVHDIDLKDSRYELPETSGVARLIDGICRSTADDAKRLSLGADAFDHLYAAAGGTA
ncbi:MAG: chromate resistance protein [Gemmatimonadaceae bacterium]